jgi:hypothetical protein
MEEKNKPVLLLLGHDKLARLNFAHWLLNYSEFPENQSYLELEKMRVVNVDLEDFVKHDDDPSFIGETFKLLCSVGPIHAIAFCFTKRFLHAQISKFTIAYYKRLFSEVFERKQVFYLFSNDEHDESLLKLETFRIKRMSERKVYEMNPILCMDISFGFLMKRIEDDEDSRKSDKYRNKFERIVSDMTPIEIRTRLLFLHMWNNITGGTIPQSTLTVYRELCSNI